MNTDSYPRLFKLIRECAQTTDRLPPEDVLAQQLGISRVKLRDMLATEKHASSLYDVSVFEFGNPVARRVLNHIQSEEQQHGEQLYSYMKSNNMY